MILKSDVRIGIIMQRLTQYYFQDVFAITHFNRISDEFFSNDFNCYYFGRKWQLV